MSALTTFQKYQDALAVGDLAAVADVLDPEVVWHQPGQNPLSGDHRGPEAVVGLLGRFFELSAGTFALSTDSVVESGALIATTVHFSAERAERTTLNQSGVDIFRVANGRIVEVWLMSEDQAAEDAFWS